MKKKKYDKVVEAEFRDDESGSARASGRRAENRRRGRRGSWVTALALALIVAPVKLMLSIASGIGLVGGEIARIVVVPLARMATVCAAFTAMCLGVMYVGAYAIRGGVAETKSLADRLHASITGSADALLALVPSGNSSGSVPKAIPVPAGCRELPPLTPEASPQEESVPVIDRLAGAVNLLLPSLTDYPKPTDSLPPIEGDILELAGGHRMQLLITSILPAIEHVESSGRQELIGDNGLAYGPLQVRREPCEDLKDRFGVEVNPADCNGNYALSEYVVRLYLGYWGIQHELRTGKVATAKDLCRTWNGGPDQGPFNKTDAYWARCTSHDDSIAYLAAE